MANQYAFLLDEHVAEHVARKLRRLGHGVTRVRSQRGASLADRDVVDLARSQGRAVVTRNGKHYVVLHNAGVRHEGIFVCKGDDEQLVVADQIHQLVKDRLHLTQQLFRVVG